MDNSTLNKQLKRLAIQNGLCQQWQDEWKPDSDTDELMNKFLRGIDFYLTNRFLSKRQMILWFTPGDRHRHNIVIDERRSLLNPRRGIAIGNSNVTIRCNAHSVCSYYLTDNSHARIIVHGAAHLVITLCDSAVIDTIETSGAPARIFISRASKFAQPIYGEGITVKDNFNLYKP